MLPAASPSAAPPASDLSVGLPSRKKLRTALLVFSEKSTAIVTGTHTLADQAVSITAGINLFLMMKI